MKRRIGLFQNATLFVAGLMLMAGCTLTGASQDPSTLPVSGLQDLLTFATDFARQIVAAFLF